MGRITRYTATELKRLPLMLTKLMGGIMTVIGVAALVFKGTRGAGIVAGSGAPFILCAAAGPVIFILASRALGKKVPDSGGQELSGGERAKLGALSWLLFLALAALFIILVTWFTNWHE